MNSPESDDHWRSLAEELGAEVAPEPESESEPGPQDQTESAPETETASRAADRPAPTPRPATRPAPSLVPPAESSDEGDWDRLAEEFGIDVPPEPAPASQAASESRRQPEDLSPPGPRGGEPAESPAALEEPTADPLELPGEPEESFVELAEEMASDEVRDEAVAGASLIEVPDQADEAEVAERRRRRRRRRGRRSGKENGARRGEEEAEGTDAAPVDAHRGDDEPTAEEPAAPKRHRNIPTWTETIGELVAANMEQHKRQDSRRRGRGRRR